MPKLTDDELIAQAKVLHREASDASSEWRRESANLYDMIAGRQWDPADEARLKDQLRPAVTFNVMAKFVDAVCGLQIANRMDVRFIPREMGDVKQNEILSAAGQWVRDEAGALAEESEAFRDMLIAGVGATEMFLDTTTDPDGTLCIERRDPLEIFVDPTARRRGAIDGRYMQRVRLMPQIEIEERWPDAPEIGVDSMGIDPLDAWTDMGMIHVADRVDAYAFPQVTNSVKKLIPVMDYQYWEVDTAYQVKAQINGKILERTLTAKQWRMMEELLKKNKVLYQSQKFKGRHYYRCFLGGGVVLDRDDSPYQKGFTYALMTGRRDRNLNTWYGLGRAMVDPQRYANKFFSEILYIINTSAKGGLMAEEDAFVDPKKAENDWARSDSIVWMEEGAIQLGKVSPKPQPQYPQGLDRLMQFSLDVLPQVSGMSMEMLGLSGKVQPGILEQQRKESAITVVQWAFDALRTYYQTHGRQLATYIQDFLSDGRLIKIVGQTGAQYVPLLKTDTDIKYDVIVDQSPTSPNMKEKTFLMMTQLLPMLESMGMQPPPEFLDYSPLPSELVDAWKKKMNQPNPMAQQAQKIQMEGAAAKVDRDKAAAEKDRAAIPKVQADAAKSASEAAVNKSQSVVNLQKAKVHAAEAGHIAGGNR
jgi:hypothetical protein